MKWLLLFLFVLSAGCVTTPETGRRAFILTSESDEVALGSRAYRDILKKEKISNRSDWNQVIQRLGERISRAANRPDYQWEFKLVESEEANAFCLPGGKVAVYTGILKVAENEAALAAVIGHEVAHATARHGGQRITTALGAQLGMAALSELIGGTESPQRNLLMAALGLGANVGVILPFSRANELEADHIGLIYMARAGYDPKEAPKFWQRFATLGGSSGPGFLSTHPASSDRRGALERQLPSVMPIFEKSSKIGVGTRFLTN